MSEPTQEQEQHELESYCKVCNQERLFVNSLSPPDSLICCVCGYRQAIIPFKLITDQFGFKIVYGDKI